MIIAVGITARFARRIQSLRSCDTLSTMEELLFGAPPDQKTPQANRGSRTVLKPINQLATENRADLQSLKEKMSSHTKPATNQPAGGVMRHPSSQKLASLLASHSCSSLRAVGRHIMCQQPEAPAHTSTRTNANVSAEVRSICAELADSWPVDAVQNTQRNRSLTAQDLELRRLRDTALAAQVIAFAPHHNPS